MGSYLLRGILIGLLFGIPAGAVGTMTVQRTWNHGVKSGLLTGLGSSAADSLYAAVGVFGLTMISDFLLHYQKMITLFGGSLILFMGIRMIIRENEMGTAKIEVMNRLRMFLTSFVIGITNPAAILTFLFAYSYFGISNIEMPFHGIGLVCGVFIGTYLWWAALSVAAYAISRQNGNHSLHHMNKIFGGLLTTFGTVVFLKVFL